jgi:Ca-activated chloride channel family protein
MRFEHPQILWLLLALPPALLVFFWWSWRKRQRLLTQFIQARLLSVLTVGISPARQKIRSACLILAVVGVLLALARPQWHFDWDKIEQRGLDIVVAIDTSKSMLAGDIAPNRLARAKLAALDLMQQARADRLGLVAFAGNAFLECPLTIDDTAFRQSVEALEVNTIPQGGTAIASAINTALTAFKEKDHYKVLVLFSDGEDNDPALRDALEAAQDAAKQGLRIFTIGIGKPEGELLRVTGANGNSDYIRDSDGNVVKSHLNEALLQQIAGATAGGFYLPLRANTIDTLYEKGIAPLPKSESKEKLVRRYHEQFHWPLAAAVLLLLAEMFLPERKRKTNDLEVRSSGFSRSGPPEGGTPNKTAWATTAVVVLLILPNAVIGSPSSALRQFKAGQYDKALNEYQRLLQIKTDDPRLNFNAGAAAYRMTNYDVALQQFNNVLSAPDLKLQQAAFYNLGNTQYRIGQSAKDLAGMEEAWQAAIKCYEHAVDLNRNDADAAHNLAFVRKNVELIIQLREAARRAKEEADEATRRRNYHRALEIMENLLQTNPTAKQFQDYTKKLKDIDEIAAPRQP